jgi:hypothetical protein
MMRKTANEILQFGWLFFFFGFALAWSLPV